MFHQIWVVIIEISFVGWVLLPSLATSARGCFHEGGSSELTPLHSFLAFWETQIFCKTSIIICSICWSGTNFQPKLLAWAHIIWNTCEKKTLLLCHIGTLANAFRNSTVLPSGVGIHGVAPRTFKFIIGVPAVVFYNGVWEPLGISSLCVNNGLCSCFVLVEWQRALSLVWCLSVFRYIWRKTLALQSKCLQSFRMIIELIFVGWVLVPSLTSGSRSCCCKGCSPELCTLYSLLALYKL